MLKVYLLGRFRLVAPGGEVALPTAKVRMLAAYLFWHLGQWARRGELRGLLWGDSDEQRASANLRTALYTLRRNLAASGAPGDILEVRRDAVRARAVTHCWVDARVFEERAWAGLSDGGGDLEALTEAASLYRGDLVADLDAEWCQSERLRLADLHLGVRRKLVERLTTAGLYQAAVSHARRWLAVDPLDESAHQALMGLYGRMGQPARVVEQFEECRRVFEAELGMAPSEATVRLLRDLTGSDARSGAGRSSRVPTPRAGRRPLDLQEWPFSDDPLRNARLLLVYAGTRALAGDMAATLAAVEIALEIYERLGDHGARARACLILAQALLEFPARPLAAQATLGIETALTYYRPKGPSSELCWALSLASDAAWFCGQVDRAAELAGEGLEVVAQVGDAETEARLRVLHGQALRGAYRLADARAALERAGEFASRFGDSRDVSRFLVQEGLLLMHTADLPRAESVLREALTLYQMIPARSPRVKHGQAVVRFLLTVVQYYRGRSEEVVWTAPNFEVFRPAPEVMTYLLSLFAPATAERPETAETAAAWLRTRLADTPVNLDLVAIRLLLERLLAVGLERQAASWAGLGARLARDRRWLGWTAVFYSRLAVALARRGRIGSAATCRRRAAEARDAGDELTVAWLDWADGLIARARGHLAEALRHLEESRRRFEDMDDRYDARQVGRDLARLSPPRQAAASLAADLG